MDRLLIPFLLAFSSVFVALNLLPAKAAEPPTSEQSAGHVSEEGAHLGKPKLETVYARFRADMPEKNEVISTHGAIDWYVRNVGDEPVQLGSVDLDGQPIHIDSQDAPVVWYEQRPWRIEPGEVGQILLRVRGLSAQMGKVLLENPSANPLFHLTAHWEGGMSQDLDVPFVGQVEPFQINFFAFSKDLKRLWIYVQNNNWIYQGDSQPVKLQRVVVGGKEVTDRTTFGEQTLRGNVVPLVVDLEQPLQARRPVSVLIQSAEGLWTGHTLRAIPSRTILQVCVLARATDETGDKVVIGPRKDWLEDIANHCANTVSVVAKSFDHLPRAKALGLSSGGLGSFVRGYSEWARAWDNPDYPEIVTCWMDEVDKRKSSLLFKRWQEMQQWQREQGKRPPLHISNVMYANTMAGINYAEIGDGIMNAHGLEHYTSGLRRDFGRLDSFPYREFRRARRPFFPYFRNAELPVPVDVEKKIDLGTQPPYKRCVSPEEERWMYYGCLLQGAKGVFHWAYTSVPRAGYYQVKGPLFRLGLGGVGDGQVWEYKISQNIVDMLQATWSEIGRCNAEWSALAPYIAISDVSSRAKVRACVPALNQQGKPAASVSALIAGLDTMLVVALNHNMTRTNLASERPSTFEPTKTTVDVTLPSWLKPVDVFRVSYRGLTDVLSERLPGEVLRFENTLAINDLVVITSDPTARKRIAKTLALMQEKLKRANTNKPVSTKEPSPYQQYSKKG